MTPTPMTTEREEAAGPKLLPCPFCGSDAIIQEGGARYYVACLALDCPCAVGEGYDRDAMPDHSFADRELAAAAWNRRFSPAPASQEEELKRIRISMALLQQNAEGCAINHYKQDFDQQGMPGWLRDTQKDLEALTTIIDRITNKDAGTK